jgi:4-alpha-glucanotransferase
LNDERVIDRDAVWRLKLDALDEIWRSRRDDGGFDAWARAQGSALHDFATWSVLAEHHGPDWRSWPAPLRHPRRSDVAAFAAARNDRVRFHAWLQWCISRQLARAAEPLIVMQDLPIGFDPGGADAWCWQDLLANGVSVGAPPDEFNSAGQDWGLPPFVPWKLRAAGYRPFVETVRAAMASGRGLRIDHVMGLFRLWWVPRGASPRDGAYVRYPADDLLDIVALESHRARAVVVGEDLGTVEAGVRETLGERNILSYRVLWFEDADPATWPPRSMAAVTTHDLPTVVGMWTGSDLDAQRAAGLEPNDDGTAEIHARLATATGLGSDAPVDAVVEEVHRLLARAPSVLLTATLDDVAAEAERPNIPGGDDARPNWSLALPVTLDELQHAPLVASVAAALAEGVRTVTQPDEGVKGS